MGIGMSTAQKSKSILRDPWIVMWMFSLMQCCGTNDRVQYADIGLPPLISTTFPTQDHIRKVSHSPALENRNRNKDQAIYTHNHHREYKNLLQSVVASYENSPCEKEHGKSGTGACHGEKDLGYKDELSSDSYHRGDNVPGVAVPVVFELGCEHHGYEGCCW